MPRVSETGARISGATRAVGIIGWPVSHSLSPAIHNAAFAALGMDWVYVPLPVPPGSLAAALPGLAALGFEGANLTMPHKTEAAELLVDLSDDARRLQAVNTVVVGPDGPAGHNTDAPGFERFLERDAGFDPAGRTALVYGAGAAARACALALARRELDALIVVVRDPTKAVAVERTLEGFRTRVGSMSFDDARMAQVDLVVNATPLGAKGEELPLPHLRPDVFVVDLLYGPASTPIQVAARAAGSFVFGGVGLLLHQAALSFELWTGVAPPLPAMSAAALAALAEIPA